MRKFIVILFALLFNSTLFNAQNNEPNYQSNNSLDFKNFINGVKYAYVAFESTENIDNNLINKEITFGIIEYLEKIVGFENVEWGSYSQAVSYDFSSMCDLVIVRPYWKFENSLIVDFRLVFESCNHDEFQFIAKRNIWPNSFIQQNVIASCKKLFGVSKYYSSYYRLNLPSEITNWTEVNLKDYFKKNGIDEIEGIYEEIIPDSDNPKQKLGLIKLDSTYNLIYLDGAKNYEDWQEGELKAQLIETSANNLFKVKWRVQKTKSILEYYIGFKPSSMELVISEKTKQDYLKLFPSASDNIKNRGSQISSSGTGFCISSKGIIITNYHVVENAKTIKVRGVNSNYSRTFNAKVLISDKNNDLSIIQIDDKDFNSIKGSIPYSIKTEISKVGESTFVLGYPLRATMGDEIKLTNGIISSLTGFQGEVNSYQISAPIQPGNSGGPLIDSKGNVIGIINAKHLGAENVSYAIKSNYLKNLIDLMDQSYVYSSINPLKEKSLTEQVELVKGFVYIIEVGY